MTNKVLVAVMLISFCSTLLSQNVEYPESFDQHMELYPEAMGSFHFPISSENQLAQAYFNQGFQLMFAFAFWFY